MARKQRKYRRLPGRPFSPFSVQSLWQGPDHLLWVNSFFFHESYKHFYFKDIQSLVIRRSDAHQVWNVLWGVLMAVFGLAAWFIPGTPYVSGTFASIFLVSLLTNIALGPACSVYLQTAVQVVKLSSLKRVRTAYKAIDQIKALVESVQGPLYQSKRAKGHFSGGQPGPLPADVTKSAPPMTEPKKSPVGPFNPLLHRILFGTLLALGVLGTAQLMLRSLPVAAFETLLHAIAQVMAIMALVRWYRHLKGTLASKLNWLALVLVSLQSLIGQGLYVVVSFRNPELNYNTWAMFKRMFELHMSDHPLAWSVNITFAAGSLLLGAFGLMVLRRRPTAQSTSVGDRELLKK